MSFPVLRTLSKVGFERRLFQSRSSDRSSVMRIVPSGMSRPIENSGSVVDEIGSGPIGGRGRPDVARAALPQPEPDQALQEAQARKSAAGWSPTSIIQLIVSG